MRHLFCDVAIIGAGTAGLSARKAAIEAGRTVLLIESGPYGTTCARVGCMPSKLLIAAAAAAQAVRDAGAFGVGVPPPAIDGRAVMERVRRERDRFVAGVLDDVAEIPDAEKLHGFARFTGPTTLAVGDDVAMDARAVVIATGSHPSVPDAFRACRDLVLTNDDVFELETLPASLAVVGAGPLGIELAQAFGRLGVRVTVFDKGTSIGGLKGDEAGAAIRSALAREITLVLGVEIEPSPGAGGVTIRWTGPDGEGEEVFERVLVAAGRSPNLDGLDLGAAGLELDERGVPVFDRSTLRCRESAVFLAGDATADRPVLHEATDEGLIAGSNAAAYPDVTARPRRVPFAITYTDPEIAIVGENPATLDGAAVAVGTVDLSNSGRARIHNEAVGFIAVAARRRDGVLVGGEIVGPGAEHLGHLLAWIVQLGLTVEAALALPFYHPTLEESLRSALRAVRP